MRSGPKRSFGEATKGLFYLGIALGVMGLLSSFIILMQGIRAGDQSLVQLLLDMLPSLIFVLLGGILMAVGAKGGKQGVSHPVRDPNLLSSAGIEMALRADDGSDLPTDEKLERLARLHDDGMISAEDYERKVAEISGG